MKESFYQNLFCELFCGLAVAIIILFPQISASALAETEIPVSNRQPKKAETKTAILSTQFDSQNINTATLEFPVQILVNPGGQAINAVGIDFHFNQNILEATKINLDSSFCDLFIESWFDNKEGQVQISCGKPYPGINEQAQVATVYFRLKDTGWNQFTFASESQVLANDGFGTNVLSVMENKTVYLQ